MSDSLRYEPLGVLIFISTVRCAYLVQAKVLHFFPFYRDVYFCLMLRYYGILFVFM